MKGEEINITYKKEIAKKKKKKCSSGVKLKNRPKKESNLFYTSLWCQYTTASATSQQLSAKLYVETTMPVNEAIIYAQHSHLFIGFYVIVRIFK